MYPRVYLFTHTIFVFKKIFYLKYTPLSLLTSHHCQFACEQSLHYLLTNLETAEHLLDRLPTHNNEFIHAREHYFQTTFVYLRVLQPKKSVYLRSIMHVFIREGGSGRSAWKAGGVWAVPTERSFSACLRSWSMLLNDNFARCIFIACTNESSTPVAAVQVT